MADYKGADDRGVSTSTPGSRIVAARSLVQMKQRELAEQAKMSETHLCAIEVGKRHIDTMKVGTLRKVCGVLEISIDYVVNGKEHVGA